jgi:hypothetical protein
MRNIDFPQAVTWGAARISRGFFALLTLVALTACGGSSATAPKAASGEPAEDALREHAERVREAVSGWEAGTGIAVRVREGDDEPRTLLFAETTAPSWDEDEAVWLIATVATGHENAVLGHLMIALSALEDAELDGAPGKTDLLVGLLLSSEWNGRHPDAAWSSNAGSRARITLRTTAEGDVEGEFEGELMSNDGETKLTIEKGYLYSKR